MNRIGALIARFGNSGSIARAKRIIIGVAVGIVACLAGIWVLSATLGNDTPDLYRGKMQLHWVAQIQSTDSAASNQASMVLNAEIIPRLTDRMFHDTNDSALRGNLVEKLNSLPGVMIYYKSAQGRRSDAAFQLGEFGPPASAAVPALVRALQGGDPAVREPAIRSLGMIHSDPETVIPLLTKYLDDDDLNDEAATALGNFGSLARSAVPKIVPLLQAKDKDAVAAAEQALKKIDPATYGKKGDRGPAGR